MNLNLPTFERIVENLKEGLYFIDQESKITYWNKAAFRFLLA